MNIREEPTIRVGILTEKKIKFELYGDYKVVGYADTFSGIFTAEVKNNAIVCRGNTSVIEMADTINFEPDDPYSESFLIHDVVIGIDFHWQMYEKQRFIHSLELIREGDNLVAINKLPLEDYLVSVISSEMNANCSLQSLKALSVVSRSWLLAQLDKSKSAKTEKRSSSVYQTENEIIKWYDREQHKNFDVCADDHCQRFHGVTKVTTEIAIKAVSQTRGVVLLSDDKICDTRYSKSCGGVTEEFENVWEPVKLQYLTSIIDYTHPSENFNLDFSNERNARKWILGNLPSFCNTRDKIMLSQILVDYDQETTDYFRWQVEYSQVDLSSIIKEKSGIDFGDILDLIPLERGSSARLIKLKIVGSKKTLIVGKELEIRRLLSPTHLYSSAFVIDKEIGNDKVPEKFTIRGAGWGHGVGLCQIGSAVMAEKGYQFDEILLHYFSNALLKRIY